MKQNIFLVLLLISSLSFSQRVTFPINGAPNNSHSVYAFTNAKIYIDYQTMINNGVLLIKDGVVIEAGEKVNIPRNAVVYDLKGKTIYPSFIDLYTQYGMPEPKKASPKHAPQFENANKGASNWNQAVKPEVDASKLYVNDSKSAEEMRKLGFGTVLTFQKDGIARGTAAIAFLGDGPEQEQILKGKAAHMFSFDKGSSNQEYPESLMGAIALLRQTYLDAQWYKNDNAKKEFNISLQAWNENAVLPQIFEVNQKLSALRADKIGDEFGTQYLIKTAGDEYQRLQEVKMMFAKLIVPVNFPAAFDVEDPYDASLVSLTEMKHWEMAPGNPGFLERAGVTFALTSSDLKEKSAFWKNIRKAVNYGLSEKQALKALTLIPAEMMGLQQKLGALKPGMTANFIITSSSVFDEKCIFYQNWINGNPYTINDLNSIDVRGKYDLKVPGRTYALSITGEMDKPKGVIVPEKDTASKAQGSIAVTGNLITMSFTMKDKSVIRLSGTVFQNPLKFIGKGQMPTGDWFDWTAEYKSAMDEKKIEKKDSVKKVYPKIDDVVYPFCAYGRVLEDKTIADKFRTRWDAVLIKNVTVWTNEAEGVLKNKDVYITEGRIVRIDDKIQPTKLAFAKEVDGTGKHLTAGIIDEHSHIAANGGVNEGTQASSAEVRIGDIINSDDINIYRQLAGGVTACQVLHGSANPIDGQSALIKLRWGKSPEELKIKNADGFIKFALGENVKQTNWGEQQIIRFPQTRMGVEQVYNDYFTRAREYDKKYKIFLGLSDKEKVNSPFRRDLDLEAVAEILNKKRFITCHSYVQSEINMLMHVADTFGFKINTFTHILEGYKVADKMKAHGVAGSTFSDWWAYKMEVKDAIPYNGALLTKAGINTAFNSDDAEMATRLNQEAAKAIKYGGLSEEEALKMVTLNPAKMLHLDNRMGSIKVGKDADVVLWSENPLSVYARVEKTLIDGIIYYDNERDESLRTEILKERARLIQKMLTEKSAGAETQKPKEKQKQLDECESHSDDYMNE